LRDAVRGDVRAFDLDRIGGGGLRPGAAPSSASNIGGARKRGVVSLCCSFSANLKVSRPSTVTPCSTLRMVEGASERCASMRAGRTPPRIVSRAVAAAA
jgi:hypothetical protein